MSTWVDQHAHLDAWADAASLKNPSHHRSLLLLATAPYFIDQDRHISKTIAPRKHIGGEKGENNGDIVGAVLGGSPLLIAAIAAVAPAHDGEAGELLEVGAEAVLSTLLISELLKETTGRKRPNDNAGIGGRQEASTKSFPSSHVSTAMAGAAITARWLREKHEGFLAAEIGLFAGVVYVALTRIENDKHWPTDTLAGAILGSYLANTVWDAHYGVKENPGIFDRIRQHAVPIIREDGAALLFHFEF